MRKGLLGLMVFLMLTPALVCVMPFCLEKPAQAADMQQEPCHKPSGAETKQTPQEGPMLALDCMDVDLLQNDTHAHVVPPDQSLEQVAFVWADITADYSLSLSSGYLIRGPPFEVGALPHANNHTLYLTTQRLRI